MDRDTTEQLRRTVAISDQMAATQRNIEELQNRLTDENQNLSDLQDQLDSASAVATSSLIALTGTVNATPATIA